MGGYTPAHTVSALFVCAAGFLAGAAGALGLGGGGFLLLYLTLFENIGQFKAQGINLLFFIPCAVVALIIHVKNRLIEWRIVWRMALTGAMGAGIGLWLGHICGAGLVAAIFAWCLLLLGVIELASGSKMAYQYFKQKKAARQKEQD